MGFIYALMIVIFFVPAAGYVLYMFVTDTKIFNGRESGDGMFLLAALGVVWLMCMVWPVSLLLIGATKLRLVLRKRKGLED